MNKIKSLFQSRRFWASVTGVAVAAMQDVLGIDEQTATNVVLALAAWVVGDSISKTEIKEPS